MQSLNNKPKIVIESILIAFNKFLYLACNFSKIKIMRKK